MPLFHCLELLKIGRYILSQVLILALIILPEIEPRNQSLFEIKQVIKALFLHFLLDGVDFLNHFTRIFLLRLLLLELANYIVTSSG